MPFTNSSNGLQKCKNCSEPTMVISTNQNRTERRCNSSVSYTRSHCAGQPNDDEDDDIQISLAPYIQTYLAQSGQGPGCCGIYLPIPFERAARQTWWDPRFDSEILEGQYRQSSFPQVRLRFQYALFYLLVVSFSWFIYFLVTGLSGTTHYWIVITLIFAALFLTIGAFVFITRLELFRQYTFLVSFCVAILISMLSLFFIIFYAALNKFPDITPVGQFSLCIEILLVIYTVIPLPLYACVGIGGVYSILFECLTHNLSVNEAYGDIGGTGIAVRVLLHMCVHFIGLHILIMTHVRMRGTFMKVGQSLLVRRQLEMEKQLKEKMIHSVMPPKVADWLMSETTGGKDDDINGEQSNHKYKKRGSNPGGSDIRSLFRPFNMHRMENVSILFADIVGFTRMSSNKTAEELVDILNGLFERFDELCATHGCEKISTLGDCYYCVAGCPEPKPDHARACVEMGLGMIDAINKFDAERNEGVNMRVGVHTGTVLCGIVGAKRFKFDVWSNDVTLANQMESTGKPGRVHVSEATCEFLGDMYLLEDGEDVQGLKTYFIIGRKSDVSYEQFLHPNDSQMSLPSPLQIVVAPPASPPQPRPRVKSCTSSRPRPHYLHLMSGETSARLKATSLPSILNSDNDNEDSEEDAQETCDDPKAEQQPTKSPASLTNCSRYSPLRNKSWKCSIKRFKRKSETESLEQDLPHSTPLLKNPSTAEDNDGYQQFYKSPWPSLWWQNDELPNQDVTRQNFKVKKLMHPDEGAAGEQTGVLLEVPSSNEDQLSVSVSVNSRKDSGIRSNSRRSSIQQQIFVMNGMAQGELLTHRVSGYYTSSQSSLDVDHDDDSRRNHLPPPLGDNFGLCFHKLRKQSDLQLIRCVQDNVTSHRSYFVKPPLSSITLFFRQREMEREYRANAHRITEKHGDSPPTLATSRFNTYFDILISALVYTAVAISLILLYEVSPGWIAFCIIATAIQIFSVLLCLRQLLKRHNSSRTGKDFSHWLLEKFSKWYPWHICGAVLVSLPVISVLVNFLCKNFSSRTGGDLYYCYTFFVSLVHFCNFTQLNCWMKSVIASIAGIIFISLVASHTCPLFANHFQNISHTTHELRKGTSLTLTQAISSIAANTVNNTNPLIYYANHNTTSVMPHIEKSCSHRNYNLYHGEIFLDIFLLLLLVWFLNREFEISYRLSFHGNIVAAKDKTRVQSMKNQADLLLHNIIPKHVADQLKNTAEYSENHRDVGIIFASIVNFNEMYDESYLGGKEYLRVLNELIGDFDDLLNQHEFRNVEKIKTIGSTFMAASGLNPEVRRQNKHLYQHLFELMDFAMAMQKVIDDFNRDLLEFNLVLRVGYNFGDVTAGVIGTSKLFYDIWGDAVNIASRMDSTGVRGRIQVGCACVPVLSERYEFEPRGSVYVKGKDNMNVFLVKGKRTDINVDDG